MLEKLPKDHPLRFMMDCFTKQEHEMKGKRIYGLTGTYDGATIKMRTSMGEDAYYIEWIYDSKL